MQSTISTQTGITAIYSVKAEWDELASELEAPFFCRPAWIICWQRHLSPQSELILLLARDQDGKLLGVLPLTTAARRLHARVPLSVSYFALAGAGAGAADHNGPVAVDDKVASDLLLAARRHAGDRTLYLENLSPHWAHLAHAILGGEVTRRTMCPVVRRSPESAFSDSWSKKMAKNVRRRDRQIAEAGISARWVQPGPDFPAALEQLRHVHELRWKAQGQSGNLPDERIEFLRDLAEESLPPDTPWILLLEHDSSTVGAMYGLISGETFSVYKTGWDPSYSQFSLGVTMGATAMTWAQSRELLEFDYLRGPREHKRDLGCVPVADLSVILPSGTSGRLLELRERFSFDGIRPKRWVWLLNTVSTWRSRVNRTFGKEDTVAQPSS